MEKIKRSFRFWQFGLKSKESLFEDIWRLYHPKLQVYVQNFYKGDEDSCDVVSEIIIKSFEKIHTYDSSFAFSTWIYSLARHYAIDLMRKKRVAGESLSGVEITDVYSPENLHMKYTEQEQIRQAVNGLKPSDKELIFLRFYEELSYREITEITAVPLGTVKYRMSEIRKKLKPELERRLML